MEIDAYLSEILHQLTFKLWKIQKNTTVVYPKEINLLIQAFNNQYEIKIIDRIMMVNEMDKKLMLEEFSKSYAPSPLMPFNDKKSALKKTFDKKPLSKQQTLHNKLSLGQRTQNSNDRDSTEENENSGGVLSYVLDKVHNKNKTSKRSSKPALLDNKLSRMLDKKINNSKKAFKDDKKFQKFLIINALLK